MFSASLLKSQMLSALDAEGSDHYRDSQDIIPAINKSLSWCMSLLNALRENKKVTNEALRELRKIDIYQTSSFSRVSINDNVFSIDAIYPLPKTSPTAFSIPPVGGGKSSIFRSDLYYVESNFSASRLTSEEWSDNKFNKFAPGSSVYSTDELNENSTCEIKFAYLDSIAYDQANGNMIEIRPHIKDKLVAILIVKNHPLITNITDNILFPDIMRNIIVEKALAYISYQEGDGTNIYSVTEKDVSTMAQMFN